MKTIRNTKWLALTVLTPAFAVNLQSAAATPIKASMIDDGLRSGAARASDEMVNAALKNSLLSMTPEEKLRVGGDRIQLAATQCDAKSISGKKSKGVCCSPSVKFRCVDGSVKAPADGAARSRKKDK